MHSKLAVSTVKALAFDVFGTVVDWHGSIVREMESLGIYKGITIDGPAFAEAWRAGYQPAMQRVRSRELPWMTIDALHRMILDTLLDRFGLGSLVERELDHLNRVWHRLDPWDDSIAGLTRLKRRRIVTTLSNGNFALLTNLGRYAGLPWDCIVSAELFHRYKPDPETYLGTAALLGIAPRELMLVAAHPDDLRAARAAGLRTAYVPRPMEYGPDRVAHVVADGEFDLVATDFVDLARRLDAGTVESTDARDA